MEIFQRKKISSFLSLSLTLSLPKLQQFLLAWSPCKPVFLHSWDGELGETGQGREGGSTENKSARHSSVIRAYRATTWYIFIIQTKTIRWDDDLMVGDVAVRILGATRQQARRVLLGGAQHPDEGVVDERWKIQIGHVPVIVHPVRLRRARDGHLG